MSVHGFNESEVYAVGHGGEIWLFNGKKWKIDSPTNLDLSCVRCTPWGEVFACGAAGVIMWGRADAWEEVEQEVTDETIESLTSLDDRVYFCTEDGLIFSLRNQRFEKIETSELRKPT
jgi:hypothetical protein